MCVRRNKKKQKQKHEKQIRPTRNTPRNPQQPGDRDHLETARDETRPTRQPILARFHRSRVCEHRPRTALAISKEHECYTHRQTDRHRRTENSQSDNLIKQYNPERTPVLVEVSMARGGLILAAGRVRSKKKKNRKKIKKKIAPSKNTPRNPRQPGDRDHLETAREKPRPTR